MHAACVPHLGKSQSVHETVKSAFTFSVSLEIWLGGGGGGGGGRGRNLTEQKILRGK